MNGKSDGLDLSNLCPDESQPQSLTVTHIFPNNSTNTNNTSTEPYSRRKFGEDNYGQSQVSLKGSIACLKATRTPTYVNTDDSQPFTPTAGDINSIINKTGSYSMPQRVVSYSNANTPRHPPKGSTQHRTISFTSVIDPVTDGLNLQAMDEGMGVTLMHIDCTAVMKTGCRFIKHGRAGSPHTVKFRLSDNCKYLSWEPKKKSKKVGECVVRFEWVREIRFGQQTKTFQRHPDKRLEALSLSLIYQRPAKYEHGEDGNLVSGGHAEERTLDVVIEDPNEFTIWSKALKVLVEMANNKAFARMGAGDVSGDLPVLGLKTQVVLALPMLTNLPSSEWLEDYHTKLGVEESKENEHAQDRAEESVRVAIQRKDTQRELYGSYITNKSYNANANSGSMIQRQGSMMAPERPNDQNKADYYNTRHMSVASAEDEELDHFHDHHHHPTTNNNKSITRMGSSSNLSLPSPTLSIPVPTVSLSNSNSSLNLNSNSNAVPLPSPSPCEPWSNVRVVGSSDIVDNTWLQQVVQQGPKSGLIFPWRRAYSINAHAAHVDRLIDRVKQCQRDALLDSAASNQRMKLNHRYLTSSVLDTHSHSHSHTSQEEDKPLSPIHARALDTFLSKAGGLSVLLVKTDCGDVLGGYGTHMWSPHHCYYGTPESFVFHVQDHSHELQQDDVADDVDLSLRQLHVYKWSGREKEKFFQFTQHTGVGFGGASTDTYDDQNNTRGEPALWIDSCFREGTTGPCPVYGSPALSQPRWKCLMLELWVPVPN